MPLAESGTCWRRHSLRSYLHCSSLRRKLMSAESERSAGMAICSSSTPTLYMSKRSGLFSCHRMGDSTAATGGGGARGVCMPRRGALGACDHILTGHHAMTGNGVAQKLPGMVQWARVSGGNPHKLHASQRPAQHGSRAMVDFIIDSISPSCSEFLLTLQGIITRHEAIARVTQQSQSISAGWKQLMMSDSPVLT